MKPTPEERRMITEASKEVSPSFSWCGATFYFWAVTLCLLLGAFERGFLLFAAFLMVCMWEQMRAAERWVERNRHWLDVEDKIAWTIANGEMEKVLEDVQEEMSEIRQKPKRSESAKGRYSDLLRIQDALRVALMEAQEKKDTEQGQA